MIPRKMYVCVCMYTHVSIKFSAKGFVKNERKFCYIPRQVIMITRQWHLENALIFLRYSGSGFKKEWHNNHQGGHSFRFLSTEVP